MHRHVGTWRETEPQSLRERPELALNVGSASLMVIDLQNYSTNPECGWGPVFREQYPRVAQYFEPRIREVVMPNVRSLLAEARGVGMPVIYLTLGSNLSDWCDMMPFHVHGAQQRMRQHGHRTIATLGTFEHEIPGEIAPVQGDIVLNKVTKSGFTSTGVDAILRNLGVNQLILCGAATDACVETTGRDAADRGYDCVIVDDACATHNQEYHDASLRAFDRLFGCVSTTEEVVDMLRMARIAERRGTR